MRKIKPVLEISPPEHDGQSQQEDYRLKVLMILHMYDQSPLEPWLAKNKYK